jgi:hypothetical protein
MNHIFIPSYALPRTNQHAKFEMDLFVHPKSRVFTKEMCNVDAPGQKSVIIRQSSINIV